MAIMMKYLRGGEVKFAFPSPEIGQFDYMDIPRLMEEGYHVMTDREMQMYEPAIEQALYSMGLAPVYGYDEYDDDEEDE